MGDNMQYYNTPAECRQTAQQNRDFFMPKTNLRRQAAACTPHVGFGRRQTAFRRNGYTGLSAIALFSFIGGNLEHALGGGGAGGGVNCLTNPTTTTTNDRPRIRSGLSISPTLPAIALPFDADYSPSESESASSSRTPYIRCKSYLRILGDAFLRGSTESKPHGPPAILLKNLYELPPKNSPSRHVPIRSVRERRRCKADHSFLRRASL